MADVAKYHLVPNNNILTDIKGHFSLFKTFRKKSSSVFVYGVVLVFIFFSIFLAFTPSTSSSSPWFINIFTINSTSPTTYSDQSYRSHFSSIFSYFFPNSSSQISSINPSGSQGITNSQVPSLQDGNKNEVPPDKGENFEPNWQKQSNQSVVNPPESQNITVSQVPTSSNSTISQSAVVESKNNTVSQLPTSQNSAISEKSQQSCNNVTCSSTNQSNQSVVVPPVSQNSTKSQVPVSNSIVSDTKNSTQAQVVPEKGENLQQNDTKQSNNSTSAPQISQAKGNLTKIGSGNEEKGVKEKVASDYAASLSKKPGSNEGNGSISTKEKKQGKMDDNLIASLVGCDLYDGEWVRDESYPLYKPGSCSFIDEQFQCIHNGRPDKDYQKLKWKPKGCTLPRLNGGPMLNLLKGKRLVFIGDSLNRNMWESLVCILRNSVKNKKKVYEAFGRHSFRTEASYSFVFKDYNLTVEFFVAPFLVQQWDFKGEKGETKETLRLDLMVRDNDQFKKADFLIFNTGHWWTHDKISKGEDYYQEGSNVYKQLDVTEAFRKAMTTWGRWVDANVDPKKTHVLFRGYSASHFSGGQWNSGGSCDSETEPITNDTYLTPYPWKMQVLESVIKGMKTPVSYLNVTRMTDYRRDGHPSRYRKHASFDLQVQDCSHWCLPGVPDSWNELLYAEILRKQYQDQQEKKS